MQRDLLSVFQAMAWAMEPGVLEQLASVVARKAMGVQVDVVQVNAITKDRDERLKSTELATIAADVGDGTDSSAKPYAMVGSTAVVPVTGVIAKYASAVNGASQPRGTSVQAIRSMISQARQDPAVGGVLMVINSPGGSVEGLADLGEWLFAMRADGGKPVWAFGDSLMASAAYWIGSQASQVFAGRDTALPSIGVYTAVVDASRAYENAGVKVHLVASGGVKGSGVPGVPISPEALAKKQEIVNDFAGLFGEAVMRARKFDAKQLAAVADGSVMLAPRAQAAGLLDGVRQLGAVIDEMNVKFPARKPEAGGGGGGGGGFRGTAATKEVSPRLARLEERRSERAVATFGVPAATIAVASSGGDATMKMRFGTILRHPDPIDPSGGGGGGGGGGAAADPGRSPVATITGILATAGIIASGAAAPAATGAVDAVELAKAAATAGAKGAQDRVSAIMAACKGFENVAAVATMRDAALADASITVEGFRTQLLAKLGESMKPVGTTPAADIKLGVEARDKVLGAVDTVLASRMCPDLEATVRRGGAEATRLADVYGFGSPEACVKAIRESQAGGVHGDSLMDLMFAATKDRYEAATGKVLHRRDTSAILAAGFGHGTSDFPNLLANLTNKRLREGFTEIPTTYDQWCEVITDVPDFKSIPFLSISDLPDLKDIIEGKDAEESTFNERKESGSVTTKGLKFSFTRQMIINDDLGAIRKTLGKIGIAAARGPEAAAWGILGANAGAGPAMSDGNNLVSAAHSNLAGAAALSQAAVEAEYSAMRRIKGFGKDTARLEIMPKFLLVPTTLAFTADRICLNPTDVNGGAGAANSQNRNPLFQKLTPISSPYADDISATAWWLAAAPAIAPPVTIMFLRGQRSPTISEVDQGNPLGMRMVAIFDYGATSTEWRGVRKNPGA